MLKNENGQSKKKLRKSDRERKRGPKREELLKQARRRQVEAIIVWRLDRWGRSVSDLMATTREVTDLGVGFVSLTEALDLATPAGEAMAKMLAVFATV